MSRIVPWFILLVLFSCLWTVQKYLSGQTSISTTSSELERLKFPSLTICKEARDFGAWKQMVRLQSMPESHNESFSFESFLKALSYEQEEFVTFFTHAPETGDPGKGKSTFKHKYCPKFMLKIISERSNNWLRMDWKLPRLLWIRQMLYVQPKAWFECRHLVLYGPRIGLGFWRQNLAI